jgi:hypothetical protein
VSTWWEVSSIVQWVVILALVIMNAVLFRQLGIMIMGSRRGIDMSGIPVGKKLPADSLQTVSGGRWAPADWLGEKYLMFFGGTYCGECAGLMPVLREAADGGLRVAVMMFNNGADDLREYLAKNDVPGVVIPTSQELGYKFDAVAVPYAYSVGERGEVLRKGLASGRLPLAEFAAACGVAIPSAEPGAPAEGELVITELTGGSAGHAHAHSHQDA